MAYQFAVANHITVPSSWEIQGKAGKDWLRLFMQRNELAIRKPEPTSIARATAFNIETTQTFFDNLAIVLDKHKFQSAQIWNADETGTKTVPRPKGIIDSRGKKQVGGSHQEKEANWSQQFVQQTQRDDSYLYS